MGQPLLITSRLVDTNRHVDVTLNDLTALFRLSRRHVIICPKRHTAGKRSICIDSLAEECDWQGCVDAEDHRHISG